jgi:ribulose 1,5-bisphosphate synthetase/thiazole synthase
MAEICKCLCTADQRLLENQSIDDVVIRKVPERMRLKNLAVLINATAVDEADIARHVQLLFISKALVCDEF